MKRNIGKQTSAFEAKRNILVHLALHHKSAGEWNPGANKSTLGRVAYPGYHFRAPQGAAFSVARICRDLEKAGLIGCYYGYYITQKGLVYLGGNNE